jgi:hypothetical protein
MQDRGIPYDRTWRLCEEIANTIDINRIKREYSVEVGTTHRLRTPYPLVEQYRRTVLQVIHHMENEIKLERGWSAFDMVDTTVSDFMCSEERFYLPIEQLCLFVLDVRKLCQLLSQSEYEETGVLAHNQRVLVHFFVRLKETLTDIFDLQAAL